MLFSCYQSDFFRSMDGAQPRKASISSVKPSGTSLSTPARLTPATSPSLTPPKGLSTPPPLQLSTPMLSPTSPQYAPAPALQSTMVAFLEVVMAWLHQEKIGRTSRRERWGKERTN